MPRRLPPPRRGQIPWAVVLAIASSISFVALVYSYFQAKNVSAERQRIVRERTELSKSIADDYERVRQSVEQWAVSAANSAFPGDHVDPDGRQMSWRERPAVYLRVRVAEAKTIEDVHRAARVAPLDALSSCLLRVKGGVGPWAYGEVTTRAEMLGGDFLRDVRETKNDLRLRNLAYALEQYKVKDFPEARDGLKLAEYALIVLDEDPPRIPERSAAYGDDATIAQKIAATEHPIRLFVRRLADGGELLRIRRTPEGAVIQVQGDPTAAAAALEIRRQQVLGCSMANEALALVGVATSPLVAANPSPMPVLASPAPSARASATAPTAPIASASSAPK